MICNYEEDTTGGRTTEQLRITTDEERILHDMGATAVRLFPTSTVTTWIIIISWSLHIIVVGYTYSRFGHRAFSVDRYQGRREGGKGICPLRNCHAENFFVWTVRNLWHLIKFITFFVFWGFALDPTGGSVPIWNLWHSIKPTLLSPSEINSLRPCSLVVIQPNYLRLSDTHRQWQNRLTTL